MRLFRYVGPIQIAERVSSSPAGTPIYQPDDVMHWLRRTGQLPNSPRSVIAKFVIDQAGTLLIADRRSEHVACAGRLPVQSAGEITFLVVDSRVEVAEVTNQSTGYVPEPESWPAVAAALERAGLRHADRFSRAFIFRRCPDCRNTTLVKDWFFECGVCGGKLTKTWNFFQDD